MNFKIYSECIVYKFRHNIKASTDKESELFNKIYTQMISNDLNILILNLKSCLLDKLIKTNEEILDNAFNSEEISSGKKKMIYYRQWEFIIDNHKELKIIEGLSYRNYKIKKLILLIKNANELKIFNLIFTICNLLWKLTFWNWKLFWIKWFKKFWMS